MPRRCFAELVAATSRIGAATADVKNALYKPLIDVDIDFSSFWPPRMAFSGRLLGVCPTPGGGCGVPATLLRAAAVLSLPGRTIPACQDRPSDADGRLEALLAADGAMRAMRKKLCCCRCCIRASSWPTWWLGRV